MSEPEHQPFKSFDALPSLVKGDTGAAVPPKRKPSDSQIYKTSYPPEQRFRGSQDRAIQERKEALHLLEQKQRELEIAIREDTSKIKRLKAEVERFESERNEQLAKQAEELRAAKDKAELELPEARLQQLQTRETQIEADLAAAKTLEEQAAEKLRKANKVLERAQEEGKAVQEPLDALKVKVRKLQSDLRESRKIAQDFSDQTAALLRSNSRYKARVNKAEAKAEDLRSEVSKLSRQLGKRAPRNEKIADKIAEETGRLFAHCPETQLWLLSLECYEDADIGWSNAIVALGRDPLGDEFLDALLDDKQFTPFEAGCRDASVMIVGREACRMSDVYKQIAARRNEGLKVYSQEMALIALATGCDPFEAGDDVLEEMGKSHPVLSELMDNSFKWPCSRLNRPFKTNGPIITVDPDEWRNGSPLTAMGYRVGYSSTLTLAQRRKTLADIFNGKLIYPCDFSAAEKSEWGEGGSAKRLKRMAIHIERNIAMRATRPEYGLAVDEWGQDAKWLKKKFYDGCFRFRWPMIYV
jgi:hypothetical protein